MFRVHLWRFHGSRRLRPLLPLLRCCRVVKIRAECGSGRTQARRICRHNPDYRHTSTSKGCTARCCSGTSTRCIQNLKKLIESLKWKQFSQLYHTYQHKHFLHIVHDRHDIRLFWTLRVAPWYSMFWLFTALKTVNNFAPKCQIWYLQFDYSWVGKRENCG